MYGGVGAAPILEALHGRLLRPGRRPVGLQREHLRRRLHGGPADPARHGFNDGWAWGGANSQYIIDQWTRDALTATGTQNTPGIWVQLFVNGLYWGLYNACGHIDNNYAAYFFGGQPADYNVIHSGSSFNVVAGNANAWYAMFNVARYGNVAGTGTMSATTLANPAAYALMAQYLNLPDFCDYIIVNYYGTNWDWDWHNFSWVYNTTTTTGSVFQDWDGEGMLQSPGGNITNRDTQGGPTELFVQLLANSDFRTMFADHVYKDLTTVLSPTNAAAMYQNLANTVTQAIIDESARWGNITGTQYTPANWTNRLNWELGSLFPVQAGYMFSEFETPVTFSAHYEGGSPKYTMYPSFNPPTLLVNGTVENGGTIALNDSLTMTISAPAGAVIYYTTDGSDPRASGGAGIGAVYTGPIVLTRGVEIKARVLSGSTWSALNDSTFYVNLAPFIRITELMYDPAPATAAELANPNYTPVDGQEDFEFVELANIGSTTVPLQGLAFTNGVSFTFPNVLLAAGQYIVVVSDEAAFEVRYPSVPTGQIAGQYTGHFSNSGEEVTLTSPGGGVIQDFSYDPSWYPQTAGGGFSLTVRSATQDLSLWDSSSGWQSASTPNGTPGYADPLTLPLPGSVVVNEVLSHTSAAPGDMIEFYNTTSQPINIGGWYVSDSNSNLMKYQIAAGTMIGAYGYYALSEYNNFGPMSSDPGRLAGFALNEHGDDVYLSNNYNGQAGGYREHQTIDSEVNGYSRGLYSKSTGGTDFTLLETPTFGTYNSATNSYSGAPNSVPYVSPLVTDEIMYAPSAATAAEAAAGYTDNDFEYVDLYNRSNLPVSLSNYYVEGGIGYTPGWLGDGNLVDNFPVSLITLSGTTATVTLDTTGAAFQNGEYVHIGGAAQPQYDGDFAIANLAVDSGAGTTTFTYVVSGSPASPATPVAGQSLTAGRDGELQTLESGAGATWSASSLTSASYTVYAHLNLYDGDNNLRTDMDSMAQYTVTCNGIPTTVLVDQNQVPATLSVGSLTYSIATGLATATVANGLSAGSIIHISGAAQTQYDGTFVVQGATPAAFTYQPLTAPGVYTATGAIKAGLNNVSDQPGDLQRYQRRGQRRAHPHHRRQAQRVDGGRLGGARGQRSTAHGARHAGFQLLFDRAPDGDLGPRRVRGHSEQLQRLRGTLQRRRRQQHPGARGLLGPSQQRRRYGRHVPDRQSRRRHGGRAGRVRALLPGRPRQLQQHVALADRAGRRRPGLDPHSHRRLRQRPDQLGVEQRGRHARPAQPRAGSVATVGSGQPRGPGPGEPDRRDQPRLERLVRSAQRRGPLRRLSQRQRHRHFDHRLLRGRQLCVRNKFHL